MGAAAGRDEGAVDIVGVEVARELLGARLAGEAAVAPLVLDGSGRKPAQMIWPMAETDDGWALTKFLRCSTVRPLHMANANMLIRMLG